MSKIAVISDIHGNYPALKATLEVLDKENPSIWICLGDIVGYGPNPSECINEIMNRNMVCIMGNHDAGVTGMLSLKHFRDPNRKLIELSRKLITKEQNQWLKSLPLTVEDGKGEWLAVHASPDRPSKWEYLNSAIKMRSLFKDLKQRICFVGHTHQPALVSDTLGVNEFLPNHQYFINPGSVGQSRDGDHRSSCAILDLENNTYKNLRVEFELSKVLSDLENLGFSVKEAEYLMKVV